MIANDLINTLLIDRGRISQAITTGAAWEIWAQVELVVLLRNQGIQAAREVAYPPPNQNLSLDVYAQDAAGRYAIELKVESAHNAGPAVLAAAQQDMQKIQAYPQPVPGARWVTVIAYSDTARHALAAYAAVPGNQSLFQEADGIGVMVATR